jgi:hypothetical protein
VVSLEVVVAKLESAVAKVNPPFAETVKESAPLSSKTTDAPLLTASRHAARTRARGVFVAAGRHLGILLSREWPHPGQAQRR